MAVKDVELFFKEKRKNEALKKEWDKATEKKLTLEKPKRKTSSMKTYILL